MSAYWSADNSVRVGETKISVPSENGLSYSPGQKIQIFLDPSTKYIERSVISSHNISVVTT